MIKDYKTYQVRFVWLSPLQSFSTKAAMMHEDPKAQYSCSKNESFSQKRLLEKDSCFQWLYCAFEHFCVIGALVYYRKKNL